MDTATLSCHGDLASLVRRRGDGPYVVELAEPRSVKDGVESLGLPHTEIGLVVVDGRSVGWDHRLAGGEQVVVHPPGTSPDGLVSRVATSPPPRPVRFVADVHLGTLARRLRLLGVDTWWRNDADDPTLARLAVEERRVLLTRDRQLLMRRAVQHGALVRSSIPADQLGEVVARFDLADQVEPRTRCVRCNGLLDQVGEDEVDDELRPGTRAAGFDRFARCRDCGQVFWPGAHDDALAAIVEEAVDAR